MFSFAGAVRSGSEHILGGKNEIGGNKIFVEHEGTRIMLDFGMSFNQNSKYFSEFWNPRKCQL